jgi:hypothetical protein
MVHPHGLASAHHVGGVTVEYSTSPGIAGITWRKRRSLTRRTGGSSMNGTAGRPSSGSVPDRFAQPGEGRAGQVHQRPCGLGGRLESTRRFTLATIT